jgi:hypothetical protein
MSNARPRVLVVGPDRGPFFSHLTTSIAGGFAAHGCPVAVRTGRHDSEQVENWTRNNDVSIVFDINQMIRNGGGWSPRTLYASWLESPFWTDDGERYYILPNESADWSYFLYNPAKFGNLVPKTRPWSILSPGATARSIYIPDDHVGPDISFAGYIPLKNDSNPVVARNSTGENIHLDEFLTHCPQDIHDQSTFFLERTHEILGEVCAKLDCGLFGSAVPIFEETLIRTHERMRMLNAAMDLTSNLTIHGPVNWLGWDEFSPYYKGLIEDPRQLDALYASSRINLHNAAVNLHFRVFDCMAAGGFILVLKAFHDDKPGELESVFEPGEHYGNFDIANVREVMKRYLDDPVERDRIARAGRELVLEKHTWAHRVERVLRDLGFGPARAPLVVPTHMADIVDPSLQASTSTAFGGGG